MTRAFRILPILLVTAVTMFLTEGSAHACLCEVPGMAVAYSSATTVFIGKVESVTRQVEGGVKREDPEPAGKGIRRMRLSQGISWPVTTFSVSTVFAGPKMTRLEYKGVGSDCPFRFRLGESYLIYAARRDGALKIDQCVRILVLAEAAEEVKHLESLRGGRPSALLPARP